MAKALPPLPWHNRVHWIMVGTITLFLVPTAIYATWPLDGVGVASVLSLITFFWLYTWRSFISIPASEEPFDFLVRTLVPSAVLFVIGTFLYGLVDAERDLASFKEPYTFHFKSGEGTQLRIFLRHFDKGVLLRNAIDNSIEFRKWDDVVSINKRIPDKSGPLICSLFGWNCGSRNIAGPL